MFLDFQKAFTAGVERVFAWADLLDAINVYPVADGDTGRNLVVSLAPLRRLDGDCRDMTRSLLLSARGNSGNIASRFLSAFVRTETLENLVDAAAEGRRRAWLAVKNPKPGTMLTLFDAFVDILGEHAIPPATGPGEGGLQAKTELEAWGEKILARLEETVRSPPELLPKLKQAIALCTV